MSVNNNKSTMIDSALQLANQSEEMLAVVQELRDHVKRFPQACAPFESIKLYWTPCQLFPPDDSVLRQAVNVMVNAGELEIIKDSKDTLFRVSRPIVVTEKLPKSA